MSRLAACPKCRNQFSLPELTGPATIACPFCQAHINIKVKPTVPAAPPPAMVVQPSAMQVARAMPVDDDDDEEEVRPKKKKKKKKVSEESTGANETWMKVAILIGVGLTTVIALVGAFAWYVFSAKSGPAFVAPTNNQLSRPGSDNRELGDGNGDEVAEATGSEKFELSDKSLVHQDFIQSFHPSTNIPGLQKEAVKEAGDSLSAAVLDRVKKATVYIETESDRGGGSGSGFFAFEKGLVITNAHVVDMLEEGSKEPKSVKVFINHGLKDQQEFKVITIKVDRKNDLALLRLANSLKEYYPEPLPLASSRTTHETQKVFSLGFPFGNSAGKEVTVTPIAVSSLRYENERINVVQFAGALNPGNSGGPIVDISGRVVAVAVRIYTEHSGEGTITNTGISFGVPCDEVAALFHGRADRLDLYPPIRRGGVLQLPVMLRLTEHSPTTATPKIKITTGESKTPPKSPAPGATADVLNKSESKQVYSGSIQLPELEKGKVYWIQPQLTFGKDEVNWLEPMAYQPKKILEEKPMPALTGDSAALGEMKMQQRYQWNMNTSRGSFNARIDYSAKLAGGSEPLKDLRIGAKANDRALPHQYLQRMWTNRIGENESFSRAGIKLGSVLNTNLNQWHDLAQLNTPKEKIEVGKTWKAPAHKVILDYLFGFDSEQQCALNCEYLGSYEEDGKMIGVIRLQGDLVDQTDTQTPISYGKVTGLAMIDGQTRQVLDFMLRCDARKKTTSGNSSALSSIPSIEGIMQLRLQRKDS